MRGKLFSLVLIILMFVFCFPTTTLSADSLYVRKVVSVVYDDSGSMNANKSMNWSYANYAMQTLCGLLNAGDEFYITYMSNPDTAVIPTDFSSNRQAAVDNIRTTLESGNTPQLAINTARDKLVESYSNNSSSDTKTEYWLVILTDGAFNGETSFGKTELDGMLKDFSQSQINAGMDLYTVYLAVGSNSIEAASNPNLNIIAKKSDDGKAIVSVLSELSNSISGRYRLSKDDIMLINDSTVELTTRIPLANIAVLMQNSSATLNSIVKEDNTSLSVEQQVSLKYPEKSGWTTDTNLNGKALIVKNAGKTISAGKYTLTFSDPVDINALDFMFEPALELQISVFKNSKIVTDMSLIHEKDIIDLHLRLFEYGTDKEIDTALLDGDVSYELGYKEDNVVMESSHSMTLSGITVNKVKTEAFGTLTLGGYMPLTASLEIVPPVVESDYELRLSVMKDGEEATDLSALKERELISVTAKIYEVSSGEEVDISSLGASAITSIGYSESDTEVLKVEGLRLPDVSLKALKTDFYASVTVDKSISLSTSLSINPIDQADFKLSVFPQTDPVMDRDDVYDNMAVIRFVITKEGVPVTKEESIGLPFEISVNRKIPYYILQEEDGSYIFGIKSRWTMFFYPAGEFAVTGTLNNTITESGTFEITSEHIVIDSIIFIGSGIFIIFIICYATRRKFKSSNIVRRIFFITDGKVREGIRSSISVGPLTGWRQFLKRACTRDSANLTFIAGKQGDILVKSRFQKTVDYQEASITNNHRDILSKFSDDNWKKWDGIKKSVRISRTTALYLRYTNNIVLFYIEDQSTVSNSNYTKPEAEFEEL